MSELKFKRWFVEAWGDWLVRIEPRQGGDVGVSDLMVVVDRRLVPVELKLWSGGKVSDIRPSQKVWHRQAAGAGLVTVLAAGEPLRNGRWAAHCCLWNGLDWYRWERDGLKDGVTGMVRGG